MLQTTKQLFLDSQLEFGGDESFAFALRLSFLVPLVYALHLFLSVQSGDLELPLSDDHLVQLGESLLALVALELGPELKVIVEDGQRLLVVLRQFDLFPKLLRQVSSLDGLHVEVAVTLVLKHSSITRVCQWARMARAQTRQIVLVSAESLCHSPIAQKKHQVNLSTQSAVADPLIACVFLALRLTFA